VLAYPEDRILRPDKSAPGIVISTIQPSGTVALKTTPGEKDAQGARPTPISYRGR
jgi:hypothetical protein